MELLGTVTRYTTPTDTDPQTHARHAAGAPANVVTALLGACPRGRQARARRLRCRELGKGLVVSATKCAPHWPTLNLLTTGKVRRLICLQE